MSFSRFFFGLLFGKRLPRLNGKITVEGLEYPIMINRDTWGIPYIRSKTVRDGWFGLGFCQGQDRSFQLELIQRISRGTLSEMIGRPGLSIDRLSRRIGFQRSSNEQFQLLDEETRSYLRSYSEGINKGRAEGSRKKAHEFTLLRCEPSTFTPEDTLGTLKVFAFQMASNWDSELTRLRILIDDGEQALRDLDQTYLDCHPVSTTLQSLQGMASGSVDRLSEDIDSLLSVIGQSGGSNNWALSGDKTYTGRSILSNDTHLNPTVPSQWYLANLETPEWQLAGAGIVGLPGFVSGHNGHIAWGVTAGLGDNTDLYIESQEGECSGYSNSMSKIYSEQINIKGEMPVCEEVVVTERGPIISPSLGFNEFPISMKSTWLKPELFPTLVNLPRARTFEDFQNSWNPWPFSTFNMVYSDTAGNIGWQFVGDTPIRSSGNGIIPGLSVNNWLEDPIPLQDLPYRFNPDNGMVASANNKPAEMLQNGIFLGHDWVDGYRIQQIVQCLEAKNDWSIHDVMTLQMDQEALPWIELRDFIMNLNPRDPDAIFALELLSRWNGHLVEDSSEASVYQALLMFLTKAVAEDRAPTSCEWAMGKGFHPLNELTFFSARRISHLIANLRKRPEGWFSDSSWEEEAEKALANAVCMLRTNYGDDLANWGWGKCRKLTITHPAGSRKWLGKVFNLGPFPWGGDINTVSQAASPPFDPFSHITTIATMRMSIDVGQWDNSRFILPGGQSGNPVSTHYADMLELWRIGGGVPIYWNEAQRQKHTKHRLLLIPE